MDDSVKRSRYSNDQAEEEIDCDELEVDDDSKSQIKSAEHQALWQRTSTSTFSSSGDDQPEDLRMDKTEGDEMDTSSAQVQTGHRSQSISVV